MDYNIILILALMPHKKQQYREREREREKAGAYLLLTPTFSVFGSKRIRIGTESHVPIIIHVTFWGTVLEVCLSVLRRLCTVGERSYPRVC